MGITKVDDQGVMLKKKVESFFVRSIKNREKKGFCITRDKMAVIMDKWSLFVIYNLAYYDLLRFSKLKMNIKGISSRMLTVTLKKLEAHKIVKRKVYAVVPPKVEYSLTEFGIEFAEKSLDLNEWLLDKHMSDKKPKLES